MASSIEFVESWKFNESLVYPYKTVNTETSINSSIPLYILYHHQAESPNDPLKLDLALVLSTCM